MTAEQRVFLIAGLAGADPRTVRRYLETGRAHGAHLQERLTAAASKVAAMAGEGAVPATPARKRSRGAGR